MTHITMCVSYPIGLRGDAMLSVIGLPVPRRFPLNPYENVFATHYQRRARDLLWERIR